MAQDTVYISHEMLNDILLGFNNIYTLFESHLVFVGDNHRTYHIIITDINQTYYWRVSYTVYVDNRDKHLRVYTGHRVNRETVTTTVWS